MLVAIFTVNITKVTGIDEFVELARHLQGWFVIRWRCDRDRCVLQDANVSAADEGDRDRGDRANRRNDDWHGVDQAGNGIVLYYACARGWSVSGRSEGRAMLCAASCAY
jgi:hypothetical protein